VDEQTRQLLKQYAADALDLLADSITMYEKGRTPYYRVAAMQLRLLLCDTTYRHEHREDIALLPALKSDLRLPLLGKSPAQPETVDLQTWLESPNRLINDLTIRQMIRRVCDTDGGAHVEIKPLAGLPRNEEVGQWVIDVSILLLPYLINTVEA
jgi:hypothetical protein